MKRGISGALAAVAVVAVLTALAGCATNPSTEPDRPLRVASAANFYATAKTLAAAFEAETGSEVQVVSGSSGKHVAQILAGAPFDVLLSADTLRPRMLVEEGIARPDQIWIYAVGVLVAWHPDGSSPADLEARLLSREGRVAIANPDLAPYGRAAAQVLEGLGSSLALVRGENVSQAYQFTSTGSVDVGLVSLSQIPPAMRPRIWLVPDSLYDPILQGAAIVSDHPAAVGFRRFLDLPRQQSLLEEAGYRLNLP